MSFFSSKTFKLIFNVLLFGTAIFLISKSFLYVTNEWNDSINELNERKLIREYAEIGFELAAKKKVSSYAGECGERDNRIIHNRRYYDHAYIFCKSDADTEALNF